MYVLMYRSRSVTVLRVIFHVTISRNKAIQDRKKRQYHECLHGQTVDQGSGYRWQIFQGETFPFGKHIAA